jgi:hypothetical protein
MTTRQPSSTLTILVGFALFCGSIALVGYTAHASEENTRQVDQTFAACPAVRPVCVVRKTQNAKFAEITRVDFEAHACTDGRSATRESSRRVVLSTYEPIFVDMNPRLRRLAQQQGCIVQ